MVVGAAGGSGNVGTGLSGAPTAPINTQPGNGNLQQAGWAQVQPISVFPNQSGQGADAINQYNQDLAFIQGQSDGVHDGSGYVETVTTESNGDRNVNIVWGNGGQPGSGGESQDYTLSPSGEITWNYQTDESGNGVGSAAGKPPIQDVASSGQDVFIPSSGGGLQESATNNAYYVGAPAEQSTQSSNVTVNPDGSVQTSSSSSKAPNGPDPRTGVPLSAAELWQFLNLGGGKNPVQFQNG